MLHYRQLFIKGNIIIGEWGIFGVRIFLHYNQFFIKGDFVIGRVECMSIMIADTILMTYQTRQPSSCCMSIWRFPTEFLPLPYPHPLCTSTPPYFYFLHIPPFPTQYHIWPVKYPASAGLNVDWNLHVSGNRNMHEQMISTWCIVYCCVSPYKVISLQSADAVSSI